jgi:hypothetical protein
MSGTIPWIAAFIAVLGLYLFVRSRRLGKTSKR